MVKSLKLRTADNTERFDPVRNLWRNVLIVALEDAIKKRKYMDGNYVSKYNSLIRMRMILQLHNCLGLKQMRVLRCQLCS